MKKKIRGERERKKFMEKKLRRECKEIIIWQSKSCVIFQK